MSKRTLDNSLQGESRELMMGRRGMLWTIRTTAATEELGLPFPLFRAGLQSSNVLLNRKSLADLAIWEPRTFKALTDFAWSRAVEDGLTNVDKLKSDPPEHVVTREMLKAKKKF
ncbi:hypothetical protein J6590_051989 [Homalodisca vitripennis]|nr:hypothetical protein J6590_051989 [Homalodisca vitripennis]